MHNKISYIFTFISSFKKEEILNLDKNVRIIFRNYNKKPDKDMLLKLRKFCKINNRKIYLANEFKLAVNLNFDGAYIPSFNKKLNEVKYSTRKDFTIIGSAHDRFEIDVKNKQKVDIIFLSPLFKTKDYLNGLGVIKFNLLSNYTKKNVIALGGISKKNVKKIKMTNSIGFSGISYFNK